VTPTTILRLKANSNFAVPGKSCPARRAESCVRWGAWFWFWAIMVSWPALVNGGPLVPLSGHLPPAKALVQAEGRLPSSNMLHLAIALPWHHQDALTNLLRQLYDPTSPAFHHFLTSAEFTAEFGPTEAEYQQVVHFAEASAFRVAATFSNRAMVEVYGRVPAVEKAFRVHLQRYRHPKEARDFYAPDAEPTVETNLPVRFVGGLSDYHLPHPASLHVDPHSVSPAAVASSGSVGGFYAGQDFRTAYATGVTNTGTGQSVGLVEFDKYYLTDVTNYLALPGIGLGKTSVTLSNIVLGGLTGSPGDGNTEVALDIDMAISMAPGLSTIYVYEATNDAASPDLIINRMVSDNLSRQLSCSWTGFTDPTIEWEFLEFGAQGQSFFQASGDSGAYVDFQNPVQPPSDNPNLTVVGGTTLTTTGPAGSWVSETVWSWFNQALGSDASSGGISPTWSIPAWQSGISMNANGGSTKYRNLPDVALTANYIFLFANNGSGIWVGGTSAAAPLWAGLTALLNQQLTAEAQSPAGFLNPGIYALAQGSNYSACFHDITVGNNTNGYTATQFFATNGYDLCTGWGTPIGQALIRFMAPEPLTVSPSTGFTSSGTYGGPFTGTNLAITLTNVAASSFQWTVGAGAPWLSVSPSGGTLAAGATATVTLSLNAGVTNLAAASYTNNLWFTNISDNVVQSQPINLTISPATPVVTWTTPASIPYGTALSATQLDAVASVAGAFAYNPSAGKVLDSGTTTLVAVFTPSDTVDYYSKTSTASLLVSPAAMTVAAANASRLYGQSNPTLQGSITGLQNGDNISAAYRCSATSSSPVGTYPIIPSLVDPADWETNYTVTLTTGLLKVARAPVTVVWSNPAAMTEGTALSALQLNATASVPGSFVYDPPSGTVPAVGTNILTAVFTPSDTLDYGGATNAVVLAVSAAATLSGNAPMSEDSPLLPVWGAPVMLAAIALFGMAFLRRQPSSLKP